MLALLLDVIVTLTLCYLLYKLIYLSFEERCKSTYIDNNIRVVLIIFVILESIYDIYLKWFAGVLIKWRI